MTLSQFMVSPAKLRVRVGAEVTWTNRDAILHTVTAGTPDKPTGEFDGQLADAGAVFTQHFEEPGTYPFFCSRHVFMRGEIEVGS